MRKPDNSTATSKFFHLGSGSPCVKNDRLIMLIRLNMLCKLVEGDFRLLKAGASRENGEALHLLKYDFVAGNEATS